MILKDTKLKNSLKNIAKGLPEVDDILVFGSIIRGKIHPSDIDIMILFKKAVDKDAEYIIRKEIEKHYGNASVISKTLKTALEPTFDARESILFEGVSLLSGKNLAKDYGFSSMGMIRYEIKGWTNLQKTKLYHALNGRSGKGGMLKELDCTKFSDNIIIVPLNKIEQIKDFIESWKINYTYMPILIPERMNSKKILQQKS